VSSSRKNTTHLTGGSVQDGKILIKTTLLNEVTTAAFQYGGGESETKNQIHPLKFIE
jgi:hypothetical protein